MAFAGASLVGGRLLGATMTDAFANRPTVGATAALFDGNSTAATAEIGEPDHNGDRRRTMWGAWTAPGNGQVVIDTVGSSSDTVLTAFGNIRLRPDQAVSPGETLAVYPAAEVELPGAAGVRYQLQASPNLVDWTDVGEPRQGMGVPIRVLDAVRGTNKRYYRYEVLP